MRLLYAIGYLAAGVGLLLLFANVIYPEPSAARTGLLLLLSCAFNVGGGLLARRYLRKPRPTRGG